MTIMDTLVNFAWHYDIIPPMFEYIQGGATTRYER